MKDHLFIVPPRTNQELMIGQIGERIVEGLYLCYFNATPPTGRLISVDVMLANQWEFFNDQKAFNYRLRLLTPETPEPKPDTTPAEPPAPAEDGPNP